MFCRKNVIWILLYGLMMYMCVCVWPAGEWCLTQRKQEELCRQNLRPHRVVIFHSWDRNDWYRGQWVRKTTTTHFSLHIQPRDMHTQLHRCNLIPYYVAFVSIRCVEDDLDSKRPLSPLSPLSPRPQSPEIPKSNSKTKVAEQHHTHKNKDKNRDSAIKVA